ncbi:hypothetical protein J6590_085384 [Homalodisca vitripennis]|nr:hypothetical protein J6590_085380 [Homalodisca vitripennis]KAG8270422.1 hypothetical protein J6590_085384 [Homalodisca vitripennis]
MEVVVEFHAFKDNDNRFIVKEFVIISHLFRAHIVFKPPYDKAELNSKMARTARWLERHFHNIKWEEGGIQYDEGIIRALCKPFVTVQKNMLGGSKYVMEWLPPVMNDGWGSSPERLGLLGMLSVNKKNAPKT